MLTHHNAESVIEILRPIMTKAGFKRRESTWYRFSRETVQVFDVQAANNRSSQKIYFNIGVTFRELGPPTHLRVFDCPVYGRLDHVVTDRDQFSAITDFSNLDILASARLDIIGDMIRRFALPTLDSWRTKTGVTAFIESDRSRGFIVRKPLLKA
ncbi:MAG: DUF4304 domain-containing protein [Verrucomicrobiota bacterium]